MRVHANYVVALVVCLNVGLICYADTITHFGDGPFEDVPDILDDVGIGQDNTASENKATSFIVPGAPGTTTMITTVPLEVE